MNTCGTCKHFGPIVDDLSYCERPDYKHVPSVYHECLLLKHQERNEKPEPLAACVIDGSDYYACFCVKEEFGCNQWAAPTVEGST